MEFTTKCKPLKSEDIQPPHDLNTRVKYPEKRHCIFIQMIACNDDPTAVISRRYSDLNGKFELTFENFVR